MDLRIIDKTTKLLEKRYKIIEEYELDWHEYEKDKKMKIINKKLNLIPKSKDKGIGAILAFALYNDLSYSETLDNLLFCYKKRRQFGKNYSNQILKRIDNASSQMTKESFYDSADFYELIDGLNIYNFTSSIKLKNPIKYDYQSVIDAIFFNLGESLMWQTDDHRFVFDEIAKTIWNICKKEGILKKFQSDEKILYFLKFFLSVIPSPIDKNNKKFWESHDFYYELTSEDKQFKRDAYFIGTFLTAQLAFIHLLFTDDFAKMTSLANFLKEWRMNDGSWMPYLHKEFFNDSTKLGKYFTLDQMFVTTCCAAEFLYRFNFQINDNWFKKTKDWIINQQDPIGFWYPKETTLYNCDIIAIELLELFERSRTDAFQFTMYSNIQLDQTTNLPNKDNFHNLYNFYCKQSKGQKISFAFAFLDFQDFKKVNEDSRFGHRFGDQILKKFGQHLKSNLKNHGQGFRWGGDEFAILFKPNYKKSDAIDLLNKMLKTWDLKDLGMKFDDKPKIRIALKSSNDIEIHSPEKIYEVVIDMMEKNKIKHLDDSKLFI